MNGRHVIVAVALIFATDDAHAQGATVPIRVLSTTDVELEHPFTRISGIRELSDGRLIVVDQGERLVAVVDFDRGLFTRIGREGSGPGEYWAPNLVLAALGDTTIIGDLVGRLTKLDPRPRYAGEVRVPELTGGNGATRLMAAAERTLADGQGRIYRQGRRGGSGRGLVNCEADSVAIQRTDLRSAKMDTVAWFPVAPVIEGCGVPTGPYVAHRTWVVAPNGRIALVTPEPYRVTWLSTAGTRTNAPSIAYQRVPVTNAEKQAYRDGYVASPPVGMRMSGNLTTGQVAVSRESRPFREPATWPSQKSPFENSRDAVLASPTGEIWVRKQLPHTEKKPMYDIIGGRGELVERVVIPKRSLVIGFGRNGAVYVVRQDQDDLQYLQRFWVK